MKFDKENPLKRVLSCLVSYKQISQIKEAIQYQKKFLIPENWELQLLVVDNSNDFILKKELEILSEKLIFQVIFMEENVGVSGAYIAACKKVIQENFDFLWLWDQDSVPSEDCLLHLAKTWEKYEAIRFTNAPSLERSSRFLESSQLYSHSELGVVLPQLSDPLGIDRHWVFFSDPYDLHKVASKRYPMDLILSGEIFTTIMVNSGALISKKVIEKVGTPRLDFFMDFVDTEYSFRITKANFLMLVNTQAQVQHAVAQPTRHVFLGRVMWARNNHVFRYFYQARNEMILARESLSFLTFIKSCFRVLIIYTIKILYDKEARIKKLKAHFWGFTLGFLGIKLNKRFAP